jgi:hypothetical protein
MVACFSDEDDVSGNQNQEKLKQQSADRHVDPLGYIILIPS